jgi:predicted RNase H-like HicB family nuclease
VSTTWSVVYERTATGWSAYVPALPGLGVTSATRAEVEQLIRDGIPFHLEGLAEDGLPIPDPTSVEVQAVAV